MLFLFLLPVLRISIHAPRVGGDASICCSCNTSRNFNPRPPRGGRPNSNGQRQKFFISIHAPREGGDRVNHLG